jgi:hypothetical protein
LHVARSGQARNHDIWDAMFSRCEMRRERIESDAGLAKLLPLATFDR